MINLYGQAKGPGYPKQLQKKNKAGILIPLDLKTLKSIHQDYTIGKRLDT